MKYTPHQINMMLAYGVDRDAVAIWRKKQAEDGVDREHMIQRAQRRVEQSLWRARVAAEEADAYLASINFDSELHFIK